MNRTKGLFMAVAFALFTLPMGVRAGQIGADVNADVDAFGHSQMDSNVLSAFSREHTLYARPMFNLPAGDHARYWENMVAQYQAAQLDFVAVWLKGNHQPATFANLVTAIKRCGAAGRIKVMPFDDNPASWTALWNNDHGSGYGYKVPFDVGVPTNWAYVWDKNLKVFFENVPDVDRFKIDGRPVYRIWSGAPAFLTNLNGNGSKLLNYLRQQCRAAFGFNPYIMVSEDWVQNDPSSAQPGVVDAVCPWFTPVPGPVYSTWRTHTWDGVTTGVCIPEFRISNDADPNSPTWIVPARHGLTLATGLDGTAGDTGCAATFIEGFDDYWENTTLWRACNIDQSGSSLGYDRTHYDYPNQRINLVRQYSNNPFPLDLQEEAEGCDSFSGGVSLPGRPNFYRNGSVAIEETTDLHGGYDVCDTQPGETLLWQQVPIEGTVHLQVRVASLSHDRKMHFVIDGRTYPRVLLPATGGGQSWETVDMGKYVFPFRSVHTVALVCDTGGVSVNWWRVQTVAFPAGTYRILARDGGSPLGRAWWLRPLGQDRYAARVTDMSVQHWILTPEADGYCTLSGPGPAKTRPGEEWSLAPVR